MATVPQIARALEDVLTTTANQAARESRLIQRERKLTGASFVQGLVLGWLSNPDATDDQLAQAIARAGTTLSPQALEKRFTPAAAACLHQVLIAALAVLIEADAPTTSLLQRFRAVWILDTSTIALPAALADLFPGSGTSGGTAGCKLHVCFDLVRGTLYGPLVEPARPDDKRSLLQHVLPPPGTLRLTDLGFYALPTFRSLSQAGAFWLCRAQIQTGIRTADDQLWSLVDLLAAQHADLIDLPVRLGRQERLPARLVAVRLDPAIAARRRRKVRYIARRKAVPASLQRLALCDWDVYVTNVAPDRLSPTDVRILARARWQIELLFKLWKSEGKLATSRSQKPWRILCEIYAKLIGLVIQHWCLVHGCWSVLERSLTKAGRVVRSYALDLASCLRRPRQLRATLTDLMDSLQHNCRVNTRKTHPNLCQLIQPSAPRGP